MAAKKRKKGTAIGRRWIKNDSQAQMNAAGRR